MGAATVRNRGDERVALIGEIVRSPKTAEIIAGSIRRSIVMGDLSAGDSLPSEADLMIQFGVSRPTLREAYRILEAESLISVRRGSRGGARVTVPELATATRYVGLLLQMRGTTVGEVFEARGVAEVAAARILASRRTATDIAELNAVVVGLLDSLEGVEKDVSVLAGWSTRSLEFHRLLVEKTGNRALYLQWSLLSEIIERNAQLLMIRMADNPQTVDTVRKSLRSYQRLIKRIEEMDPSGAADHWQAHMELSSEMLAGHGDAEAVVHLFA